MSDVAIQVEGIGKRYQIGDRSAPYRTFRDSLSGVARRLVRRSPRQDSTFWALRHVSFQLRRGEVLGVIGRNGAGKSTLLKVLSRITEPTEGMAQVNGRVGSLLEVGTGFHPELTGRENIFLSGAILGMRRRDIVRKFDEIVAFAEIDQFLDTPVKHYSSGMYMRLAFAVAAHLEPDVLLVDEVLAVGDAAFQQKCLGKMSDVAREGRTVLFVSHNMGAIANLCGSAILLQKGELTCSGTPDRVIGEYMATSAPQSEIYDLTDCEREGSGRVRFRSVRITDGSGSAALLTQQPVEFDFELECGDTDLASSKVTFAIAMHSRTGEHLLDLSTSFDARYRGDFYMLNGRQHLKCRIDSLPLKPGTYRLTFHTDCLGEVLDRVRDHVQLQINESDYFGSGSVLMPYHGPVVARHHWQHVEDD